MSGFGGFGSPPPPVPGQQQAPFGPSSTTMGMGGVGTGFGGGSTVPFGASPAAAPPSSFGGAAMAPATAFGSSGTAFGGAPPASSAFGQQHAAAGSGMTFGTSPNVASTASFGSQQQQQTGGGSAGFGQPSSTFGGGGFGSGGFGGNAFGSQQQAFGGAGSAAAPTPPASGFGTGTGFGGSQQSTTTPSVVGGFGTPSTASPFGQPPTPFGGASNTATSGIGNNNPFGAPSQPSSSTGGTVVSFGMSSNVVDGDSDMSGVPGGSSPTPFGMSPFGSPMHQQSDNEDMADDSAAAAAAPLSNLPFGTPAVASIPASSGISSTWPPPVGGIAHNGGGGRGLSPIPEDGDMADSGGTTARSSSSRSKDPPSATDSPTPAAVSAEEEKLARLRAKIEEKKRKLEQKKRREAARGSGGGSPTPSGGGGGGLAERNAVRFSSDGSGGDAATRAHMPADLLVRSRSNSPIRGASAASTSATGREALENAVSLVGTCPHMCPDEELVRREREGDIQLLEIPLPGKVHPDDWTLRNTAVKRFRRSAADYKLDVPEWVRPPDVLERTCAYLEEWVMERDRQGPDPRFSLNTGNVPQPLDVYQFIWDRMRMVRKDFILQNYVGGAGGRCDARAVRCHERIARWHAACEHQLAHLEDFTKGQSQQNIQELGQTMKTLNQYYDDYRGRSLVEADVDDGAVDRITAGAQQTSASANANANSQPSHGCSGDVVQGTDPVDYDGKPLVNRLDHPDSTHGNRIISNKDAGPNRGTAEPEMRALYILLTIDNDGGMEVLKYVARLFRQRPHIYHSRPVQLALEVYKAKKEDNYARFFSILRSPDTPYLFACVMFKQVGHMRRMAFRIMSRSFGARTRDSNEPIFDLYPLSELVELLCFEDADEARAACRHFHIAVKEVEVQPLTSSSGDEHVTPPPSVVQEVVSWRGSSFREPRDPDKDFVIPLRPRKMIRTIERKLRGATRLAVCRGDVSGEGAFLAADQIPTQAPDSAASGPPNNREQLERVAEEATKKARERAAILLEMQKKEQKRLEMAARKKQEEEEAREARRREEEMERQEKERIRRTEMERQKRLEEERIQREKELQRQREKEERERALREKQRQEELAAKKRAEEEERRREIELELARKKAEEEERERHRLELERKLREEEDRRRKAEAERMRREEEERRRREAEEARRRREEEAVRLEALRKAEEDRKRREAEELRVRKAWQERIDAARKELILGRWLRRFPRHLQIMERVEESLRSVDPAVLSARQETLQGIVADRLNATKPLAHALEATGNAKAVCAFDLRRIIERLLRERDGVVVPMASKIVEAIETGGGAWCVAPARQSGTKTTILFKCAVVVPQSTDIRNQSLCDLVSAWIDSRLQFGRVVSEPFGSGAVEVRFVAVNGNSKDSAAACDATLIVIPPPWSDEENCQVREGDEPLQSLADRIDSEIPRVVLCLGHRSEESFQRDRNLALVEALAGSFDGLRAVSNAALSEHSVENALRSCCNAVVDSLVGQEEPQLLERVSVHRLGCICVGEVIWQTASFERRDDILKQARAALRCLAEEMVAVGASLKRDWSWPAPEFAGDGEFIDDYFGNRVPLPLDWVSRLEMDNVGPILAELEAMLEGSLPDVVPRLLSGASGDGAVVRQECLHLLHERLFRRCLHRSLVWRAAHCEPSRHDQFIFLPRDVLDDIVRNTLRRVQVDDDGIAPPADGGIEEETQSEHELAVTIGLGSSRPAGTTVRPLPELVTKPTKRSRTKTEPSSIHNSKADPVADEAVGALTPMEHEPPRSTKRLRRHAAQGATERPSRDELDSRAFTKKLEDLLSGKRTKNVMVGDTPLSVLLEGAPDLWVPRKIAGHEK